MKTSGGRPAAQDEHHPHHHFDPVKRAQQIEGVFDILIVSLIVILVAAMAWGLLTATGSAPWME